MRILAIVLVIFTLLVGAFAGYVYQGTGMQIERVDAAVASAVERIDLYDDVRGQLGNGSFIGTQYHEVEFLMPESFAFLTLTVRMRNPGILPMEWIEIEVKPDAADILQLPAGRTPSLAAGTRGEFSTVILTRTGADTTRTVTVSYYVLGRQLTQTYSMGSASNE